jgi:hypothetical protein
VSVSNWTTPLAGGINNKLTITDITSTTISGTFDFFAESQVGSSETGTVHVENGRFTVPLSGFTVGAGVGVGRLAEPFKTGALYDVFAGKRLASHADLVARYYSGLNHYVGQGLFVGVGLHV